MSVFEGRAIFVVDAEGLIGRLGVAQIAHQLHRSGFSEMWIRIGRGATVQPRLTEAVCQGLRDALTPAGIRLCGWHVPFCADQVATRAEVANVLYWVDKFGLAGLVADAERTQESPRFQGGEAEARLYTDSLALELGRRQLGFAFSSHDQPNLHRDLPFGIFLKPGQPALPQVYNHDGDPRPRLQLSETAYAPLLGPAFVRRYRPTANVSMVGHGAFVNERMCLLSLERFLGHIKMKGYLGHSFWCWEEAPLGFWSSLATLKTA